MKEGEIVVGTVRAVRNGKHVVVRRDGTVIDIAFEGEAAPLIGGDVIGRIHFDDFGEARMALKRSLFDTILEGHATIYMMGQRPEVTARILAKILSRSKSAVVTPGSGMSIERMPVSSDVDLTWAIKAFQPEAERLGIALNVIDVQAVARAQWEPSKLRDLTLPADIEGNRRSMFDLARLLRSGFAPQCNRMIEQHTGRREISVNFVLPYSPFVGTLGFARNVSGMGTGNFPLTTITLSESRRLSAGRNVALALAHNRLGAGEGLQADVETSPRAAHMAACFADAAASLAFIAFGGRRAAVVEYADLKEASLFFGCLNDEVSLREGVLVEATHKAVRAAAAADIPYGASAKEIVAAASRIARRVALPASRFSPDGKKDRITPQELASSRVVAGYMARNLRFAERSLVQELGEIYRRDLRQLVEEHQANENSAVRLGMFARVHVPDRMGNIFGEEMGDLPDPSVAPTGDALERTLNRDRLARRIQSRRDIEDPDETIEFGEVLAP